MNKLIFTFLLLLSSVVLLAQEDFIIQVNDSTFGLSLDKEYKLKVDGKPIVFKVMAKDTLLYDDDIFSFMYLKDYKPNKIIVEEGIEQIMITTAGGSGVLIQKYDGLNPTILNELMLSEVTKESVSYGYDMKRDDYSRKLKSGREVDVDRAILTYKGDKSVYEVFSVGKKDEGILVMTMVVDQSFSDAGKSLIDLMWNSITYKE